jgi:hypothetical protein
VQKADNNFTEVSLVYKEDDDYKIEKVDIIKTGEYFQLKGVPAFASGVAYNDIISVEYENGQAFFNELIESSGHSVVHIAILNIENSTLFFANLISFGVHINYLNNNLYLVIDIPPSTFYKTFRAFLLEEIGLNNISVSEACISDIHFKSIE